MLESVYINSVQNSKVIIKEMCKSVILALVTNIVSNENFAANYSTKKKKTDELLNEIINKEKLADKLIKDQQNYENESLNDETAYSSTNISDNKSTQFHPMKVSSPSSDKNRRFLVQNETKGLSKRSNSNKTLLNHSSNEDKTENIPNKELKEENLEENQNINQLNNNEEKLEEILNQKKKKNKYKKYKNRKGSTNYPKFPQNSLLIKKTISESVKSQNNSDRKKSENFNKQSSVNIALNMNENTLTIPIENFNKSNIENQNIHSNTSHFNKELNEKICQNIQFFSINNKIASNSTSTAKPKYNKFNNLNPLISQTSKHVNSPSIIVNDELSYTYSNKNHYSAPQSKKAEYIPPTPKFFPFLSNPLFPNSLEFDQKYFMTMMNPFVPKPLETFNILNKFEEKFFPNNFEIKLHNDIIDYSNTITKINQIMKEFKLFTLSYIENLIKQSLGYKDFIVDIHGSFATDLSIECSDIDITVRLCEQYTNIENLINTLYSKFDKMHVFDSLVPIYTASVPVLKIVRNI
jgi:hypothetical protein